MAIRFIIGRAGSGKTRHCFDQIVAAMRADPLGPPIYWILPRQATFSAERELTTRSGLDGFCRARVLSFDLLGEEVLASCGGAAVPEISAIGRQMLLGYLLRTNQEQLRFFRSVARQPGLAARLDATFAEFERCGKDPDALADLVEQLETDQTATIEQQLLREKVADFALLYRAYRDALGDERVDPHRRLMQVLDCIKDHRPLRDAAVYVDGFLDFTDRERRMITALGAVARRVDVTLMIGPDSASVRDVHALPDELDLFHRTQQTYRQLHFALTEAGVAIEPPISLSDARRFENATLSQIERTFATDGAPIHTDKEGNQIGVHRCSSVANEFELVEACDRRGEIDAVARRIRDSLRQGKRLRDIAVLVRDIDDYHELIAASFREHDIPFFVDRRRSASHHPLLQFTRSLFQIARHNWPHEAVMAVIKSGLSGLTLDEAEELENYVLMHRIRGSAWGTDEPWSYSRKLTRRSDDDDDLVVTIEAELMNRLRRAVVDQITPFVLALCGAETQPIRATVIALFEVFKRFRVRETLAQWIERATQQNDLEQRGEHEQVWAELIKLLDQLVDVLGERLVTPADFVEILESGLEQFDLALAPPRLDQVLVGQVDRTRTTIVHTVFVLGLSEGQFPRIAREETVLSDSERRSLRKHRLEIDPDSERRLLDENLLGYVAFTRASHRLIVTRPVAQENKPVNGSSFWLRLRTLFPQLVPTIEQRESDAAPTAIGTPRQLITALMRWARSNDSRADSAQPWASLYQWLTSHDCCNDAIDVMRFKAWRAVSYKNEAALSPDVARDLVPQELHASVTRIESFATCPFRHFARYHLKLIEREDEDVTAMDLGNVYHQILDNVVRDALRQRTDWCELEPRLTQQLIGQFADEVGRSLRGELMLSTARNKYLLRHIEKTLDRVCATQKAVLNRGSFRPIFTELGFGVEGGKLPPLSLKTPNGRTVLLHGKIDRVDRVRDGSEVAVIDYKMRETRLALSDVYHGLSLQLLTYLLVLQASGEKLAGKPLTPVAAFYARLLRSCEPVDHQDDAPDQNDPAFHLRAKPRGIFNAQHLGHIDAQLETGPSEVVQAFVNKDGNFGRIDQSDVADSAAFASLLNYVRRRIGELADRIIAGEIEVKPYRIGRETPCPNCEFRSVCRFDPGINTYLNLPPMKRSEVLAIMRERGDG